MAIRLKTCKVCKAKFSPQRPLQSVCSPECSFGLITLAKTKAERIQSQEAKKVIRLEKEKLKTKGDWIKEAQEAVNAYVRYRDKDKHCISCGVKLMTGIVGGGFDAGHYRSRGSSPHLRFDADRNIMGQCKRCNRYLNGNVTNYRIGLALRIGEEELAKLESDNEPRKYSIDDLKNIKAIYKAKLKDLKCNIS
jgi:hypothetical protein